MNNIALFLSSEPQIKEILLVMGSKSSPALICDICRLLPLKYLSIYTTNKELEKNVEKVMNTFSNDEIECSPENFKILKDEEINNYQNRTSNFALVFDALNSNEEILSLKGLNPDYLIGVLCKDNMNAFEIWENYRDISKMIYIVSWKNGEEILKWEKNEISSIELSIIFPMYNVAPYLEQCIESVIEWKADYLEFLFVDDGSPDNCAEIVTRYAEKDSRIHLLRKQNGGCASARQYGLERSRGRYVGFIDPDDYIDPTMFRKLLSRALIGSYEISYCGYNEIYEETGEQREISDVLGYPYNEGTSDPVRINELIAYRRIAIWRGIYLKEMIDRAAIHFYTDIKRFDDLPFKVETLSRARSVVAVPEYLYYYRMARPGQDVSADDERLYVHFPIFEYLDKFLKKSSDRRQLDYLQIVKVQSHRWALEKIRPEYKKEYCRNAKKDLRKNFGFWEGAYIIWNGTSRDDFKYYIGLVLGLTGYISFLTRPRREKKNKIDNTISKLNSLVEKNDK